MGYFSHTKSPLLSVLVPTYNNANGLRRIVSALGEAFQDQAIELCVHDDSTDDCIAEEIEVITLGSARGIYQRNKPSKGAVPNWNGLLDAAKGDYCLLMHHDEYFETPQVLQDALAMLRNDISIDGIVFPCRVITHSYPQGRLHMPTWLARWIVGYCPGYMLRRNPLGSPSVLMLRRNFYLRYDERLRWLVDSELYVRVVTIHHPRLVFLKGKGIMSDCTEPLSITSSLGSAIAQIRADELRLLELQGFPKEYGIYFVSTTIGAAIARAAESLVWTAFRTMQRLAQMATRVH